jgi:hypothetical protein
MGRLGGFIARLISPGPPRCARCAYDTTDLETARCPECGQVSDPAWRSGRPAAGSVLRRRLPLFAAAFTAAQTLIGAGVVAGLCWVMASYADFGAVTARNIATAAVGFALSLASLVSTIAVVAHRHRIAHGHARWFWFGLSTPLAVQGMGLTAWGVGVVFLDG